MSNSEGTLDFSITNENQRHKRQRKSKEALESDNITKQIKATEIRKSEKQKKNVTQNNKVIENCRTMKQKKKSPTTYDIRKAPELNEQVEAPKIENHIKEINENQVDTGNKRVAIKIKICSNCGSRHLQDHCPLENPYYVVSDSLTVSEWTEKYKPVYEKKLASESDIIENGDGDNKLEGFVFATLSLPSMLYFADTNTEHGVGIFTNTNIKEFTQFGPLLGRVIREVDIPEDFNMRDLWEIYSDKAPIYLNTEDYQESNWLRFIRPASNRENRNVAAVSTSKQLFFITTKEVLAGKELVYWQDDMLTVTKKKMEKTSECDR